MRKITAPVGTFDESTRLGLNVKQVRSRIQKERAEAMKEMSAQGVKGK